MQVLWATINPRGMSVNKKKVNIIRQNGSTIMQEGTVKFPRYGKLPKGLLQPAYIGGRTFKRAPKKQHTVVLGIQTKGSI